MNYQMAGALMIVAGCGIFGFSLASEYIREEYSLRQLIAALDYMFCELQYSASPLPQICGKIGTEFSGTVARVFQNLARELDSNPGPCVSSGMDQVLRQGGRVMKLTDKHLRELGAVLGRFDLEGQLAALDGVRSQCRNTLNELTREKHSRVRSYQTLGLCAGAALAIILV